jgi:hypothetical protein
MLSIWSFVHKRASPGDPKHSGTHAYVGVLQERAVVTADLQIQPRNRKAPLLLSQTIGSQVLDGTTNPLLSTHLVTLPAEVAEPAL